MKRKFVVDDDTFHNISKSDSEDDINYKKCSKSNYKGIKKFKRQENPEGTTKSNEKFLLEIEEEKSYEKENNQKNENNKKDFSMIKNLQIFERGKNKHFYKFS